MSDIIKIANREVLKLEEMIKKIDAFLCEAPEGCLKWQNKGGKTYYYQQYMVTESDSEENTKEKEGSSKADNKEKRCDKWRRKYIKKEEISLAKLLATKHYYSLVKTIAEKQVDALKQFIKKYPNNQIEEAYDTLSIERKNLIVPLHMSVKEQIKQWEEEEYEQTNMYAENLKFETEQGDVVRSKSEVIIANILYQHREDILYKYERPLSITVNGNEKTIYPDFTIINKHTGKIIYWEHAGRMDDSYYAGDFVRKMNTYAANGLLPGRDVMVTFETQENPLDIGVVKKLVKSLI